MCGGVWKHRGASWLRKSRNKWKLFKRWMSSDHSVDSSSAPAKGTGLIVSGVIYLVWITCFLCNFVVSFPDPNVASVNTRVKEIEDDVPADMKIFIPYDSAKLCITQV